jgi:pimeloyl-ACP methyl ester carboxylesterase
MASRHCTLTVVFGLVALGASTSAVAQPAPPSSSTFTVFVRGVQVGTEQAAVERTPTGGWRIVGSGRLGPPIDLVTRSLEVRYDADWKPLELRVDATASGQPATLHTLVNGTTAQSEFSRGGKSTKKSDTIDASAILLPDPAFSAYEALSARLRTAAVGSTISAYVAPNASTLITVGESTTERIETLARIIEARRTAITASVPGVPPLSATVWSDETGRLLRLSVPAQALDVVRLDMGSVSTRRISVTRGGDESVSIPANGFLLTGTLSKPTTAPGPGGHPTIVLVAGSAPVDREESSHGVPIFGHLANALADRGFLVLRYDKRGTGQSGGRPEAATLVSYAEDLRAAVRYLTGRKDVDRRRLAALGHGDGGWVAMIAAEKEDRIKALVLVATAGVTGAQLNMTQVERALARAGRTGVEREATVTLQKKIQDAVLTGKGWDDIPPTVRPQADSPWFQSFLAFEPGRVLGDVHQPLLIMQPMLDAEVEPSNLERLDALAKAKKRKAPVELVKLPGLNHLLVKAATGEIDEYATIAQREVDPDVSRIAAEWLTTAFAATR